MRPRNKSDAVDKCNASPWCVTLKDLEQQDPRSLFFDKSLPVFAEIGSGKGGFLIGQAQAQKNVNWLGVEKIPVIILKSIRLAEATIPESTNLKIAMGDANALTSAFIPHSLSGLYLNFSDPWPKKRHAKRRLVHTSFLKLYAKMLLPGAQIEFKTDQAPLFDFLLEELNNFSTARVSAVARNLYALPENHPLRASNVQTEYERKFALMGHPIFKAIFTLS